jgi:hypothetical protein
MAYLALPATLLGALGCYVIWKRAMGRGRSAESIAIMAITCLTLLTNPHCHPYDMMLLAVPMVLLFARPTWAGVLAQREGSLKWLLVLFLIYPIVFWILFFLWADGRRILLLCQGLDVLLLFGASVWGWAKHNQSRWPASEKST